MNNLMLVNMVLLIDGLHRLRKRLVPFFQTCGMILIVVVLLLLFAGYIKLIITPLPDPVALYSVGSTVDLVVGGEGQIVGRCLWGEDFHYRVRVNTTVGPREIKFKEFELKRKGSVSDGVSVRAIWERNYRERDGIYLE